MNPEAFGLLAIVLVFLYAIVSVVMGVDFSGFTESCGALERGSC